MVALYDKLRLDTAVAVGTPKPLTPAQPTGLEFLVFDRWLKPSGPGSTPTAFDTAQGGRLKRSIVVLDGGEVAHPSPAAYERKHWDSFPLTYIFAEAHANGKAAIELAIWRMEFLLADWFPRLPSGYRVAFKEDSILALEDSDAFLGNVVSVVRWRATGSRRMVA